MATSNVPHVNLPSDLLHLVEERVRSGLGASAEDVVCDALELLRGHENRPSPLGAAEIRARIAEGLEQVHRGEVLDGEEVFDALEARLGCIASS
jgi:antitoxin ParD1/3/4